MVGGDLVVDAVQLGGPLHPVPDQLQPLGRPRLGELPEALAAEAGGRGEGAGVAPRPLEVPVGEQRLVRVTDHQHAPAPEPANVLRRQPRLCVLDTGKHGEFGYRILVVLLPFSWI